ncbi:hypothetical protein ACFLT9_08355 [Acidobacteriota bacterium]
MRNEIQPLDKPQGRIVSRRKGNQKGIPLASKSEEKSVSGVFPFWWMFRRETRK